VSVWLSKWTSPSGPCRVAGADVGLGDPVVAAEHDRDRAGVEHLADGSLDRRVAGLRVGRDDRSVPVVEDPKRLECVDLGLQMRARRAARRPDRARAEAGAGAVGDQIIGGGADDRHVGAGKLGGVLGPGHAGEARQSGEIRLLAVPTPALEGVEHHALQSYARRGNHPRSSVLCTR
jgi:hypothetical protein